jgi:glycosyltransferase involved in cell wall biosynthesis
VARYEQEIHKRIRDVQFNRIDYQPLWRRFEPKRPEDLPSTYKEVSPPSPLSHQLAKLGRNTLQHLDGYRYQRMVKRSIKKDNIQHLTSQELGYLLNTIPTDKALINCHDLIPWVYDQDHSRRWKHNLEGIKKAQRIITVSEFSRGEIIRHLDYPAEKVEVISDAVDHNRYHPQVEAVDRSRWAGSDEDRYLLYVGSETPRMNLKVLLEALAKLKNLIPGVKLLKIGEPQSYGAREVLLKQVQDLELEKEVIFLGYVEEDSLPGFYRAADVLVYPCLYAGFGLPPLEAMACGTPVVTANTTSLPEVVGDAALMFEPHGVDELVTKLYEVLTYHDLKAKLIKRGLERARMFSWDESAEKTRRVYEQLE